MTEKLVASLVLAVVCVVVAATPAQAAPYVTRLAARHSNHCLGVAGDSTAHMANVIQVPCRFRGFSASQQWEGRHLDDGAWVFVNMWSRKCLDVAWWAVHDGADVIQANCTFADNQRWWSRLTPVAGTTRSSPSTAENASTSPGWTRIPAQTSSSPDAGAGRTSNGCSSWAADVSGCR